MVGPAARLRALIALACVSMPVLGCSVIGYTLGARLDALDASRPASWLTTLPRDSLVTLRLEDGTSVRGRMGGVENPPSDGLGPQPETLRTSSTSPPVAWVIIDSETGPRRLALNGIASVQTRRGRQDRVIATFMGAVLDAAVVAGLGAKRQLRR